MTTRKPCKACENATTFSTGSTLFFVCKRSGRYRSIADHCDLQDKKCEEEVEDEDKKRYSSPIPNPSKTYSCGIPNFRLAEKKSEVIPVKVQPSLKEAVRAVAGPSVSKFCRHAIIEKLERIKQEAC